MVILLLISLKGFVMTQLEGYVEKGWGHEFIWSTNDKYCGKFMKFNKGAKFSMHFHREKDETWYVIDGVFDILVIDTSDASVSRKRVKAGDTHRNEPLVPHQIICVEAGTVLEVSTPDSVEDNYRVARGDSQR